MYKDCRIYGPYTGKDGRKRLVLIYPDGRKTSVSYPKYLMELKLQRYFEDNETVDHFDGNIFNDDYTNLIVKDRSAHVKDDVKRLKAQKFSCPLCNSKFILVDKKLDYAISNRKRGKVGPFCSKSCAGKYGQSIQMGNDRLDVIMIESIYTTNKTLQSLHVEMHEVDTAKTGKP